MFLAGKFFRVFQQDWLKTVCYVTMNELLVHRCRIEIYFWKFRFEGKCVTIAASVAIASAAIGSVAIGGAVEVVTTTIACLEVRHSLSSD